MEKKVNKEIHGDAYFNLINNEGAFLNYIKEKIQYLEDNIASLSNYLIMKLNLMLRELSMTSAHLVIVLI